MAEVISELREPMKTEMEEMAGSSSVAGTPAGDKPVGLTKAEKAAMDEVNRKKRVEIAKVKVQLNILKNDMEDSIQNKDFLRAQQIKLEMEQLDEEQNRGAIRQFLRMILN
jgi:hypothetical protein